MQRVSLVWPLALMTVFGFVVLAPVASADEEPNDPTRVECKLQTYDVDAPNLEPTTTEFSADQLDVLAQIDAEMGRRWFRESGSGLVVKHYEATPYVMGDTARRAVQLRMGHTFQLCDSTDFVIFTTCGHIHFRYRRDRDSDLLRYEYPKLAEYRENEHGVLVSVPSPLNPEGDPLVDAQRSWAPWKSNPFKPVQVRQKFPKTLAYAQVKDLIMSQDEQVEVDQHLRRMEALLIGMQMAPGGGAWVNAFEGNYGAAALDGALDVLPFVAQFVKYRRAARGLTVLSMVGSAASMSLASGGEWTSADSVADGVRTVIFMALLRGMRGNLPPGSKIDFWSDIRQNSPALGALRRGSNLSAATRAMYGVARVRSPRTVVGMFNSLGMSTAGVLSDAARSGLTNFADFFRGKAISDALQAGKSVEVDAGTFSWLFGHHEFAARLRRLGSLKLLLSDDANAGLVNNLAHRAVYFGAPNRTADGVANLAKHAPLDSLVAHEVNDLIVIKNTVKEMSLRDAADPASQYFRLNDRTVEYLRALRSQYPDEVNELCYDAFRFLGEADPTNIDVQEVMDEIGVPSIEEFLRRTSVVTGADRIPNGGRDLLAASPKYESFLHDILLPEIAGIDIWVYLREVSSYAEQARKYDELVQLSNTYATAEMSQMSGAFGGGDFETLGEFLRDRLGGGLFGTYEVPHKVQDFLRGNGIRAPDWWFSTTREPWQYPDGPSLNPTLYDNSATFNASGSGSMMASNGLAYGGSFSYAPGSGEPTDFSWTFNDLAPGQYQVAATWIPNDPFYASNAAFSVLDGDNVRGTAYMNQRVEPDDVADDGAVWEIFPATYTVKGSSLTVRLTNAGADGYVIADGVRIERVDDAPENNDMLLISDDGAASFVATGDAWDRYGAGAMGHKGNYSFAHTGSPSEATWTFVDLPPGQYRVSSTWLPNDTYWSTKSAFAVLDGPIVRGTALLNQRVAPDDLMEAGVPWEHLSDLTFAIASGSMSVRLTNAGSDGYVVADGLRIERVGDIVGQAAIVQIVDDDAPGFSMSDGWSHYIGTLGYEGDFRYVLDSAQREAAWTFSGLVPGTYRVSGTWPANQYYASNAPLTIVDGQTVVGTATFNQRVEPDDFLEAGTRWESAPGTFRIGGTTLTVKITNVGVDGYVIVDGLRVERVGN